ncbi:DeoR/GlpR family DNA-binding transcription regulator [Paenibacillus eucommiae]|uniref:DeoR/GlpR family transcriptional regulator of sugar metabolism n=1 Tax=Paenibacillus eucommiae TaxID=1355755 RepID=A0ABS4J1H6_9BACL|nr:DeoR/GlpR family DNA-binding transcription regulator [Paenibacillus eucommiae]MBP1993684.1 DeoR/GlpR family transcriptional regulator of sugar metabolism [Paenibacillus eucommiae]
MLSASKRREEIFELIHKEKQVRVSDLKDIFSTSGVTIRSDLIYLENKGLIERNFGTVSLKENQLKDVFDESHIKNLTEKKKIGDYAVNLVAENESIMIYTGSTSLQIAKGLKDHKNLIVVTNSIITAYELGKNPYIKTIMLGGYYNPDTNAVFGYHAIQQLSDYKLDKLFLSVDGISGSGGVTSEHPYETEICRAMINNAAQVIVTADFSKVGVSRFIQIADLSEIDMLITDDKAPVDELKKIEELSVKVVAV